MKFSVSAKIGQWLCGIAYAACLLGMSAGMAIAAQPDNAIESVTGAMQAGAEMVRIDLAQALALWPAGFASHTPPSIVLDFPGVRNATGHSVIDIHQGNLRSIHLTQTGERTRLLLDLKHATTYTLQIQEKSLLVRLNPPIGATQISSIASTFSENRHRDALPLKDIQFRLGADRTTGRLIVELPNNQVGVDVRQQGRNLVVEFAKSTLPEALRRRLDVTDFATPVQFITPSQQGERVRLLIEARGDWEYNADQRDNQLIIDVHPRQADPAKPGAGYSGEKLSLSFQNIDIRALLQVIADFTHFNVVTSDSVTGSLTLHLKDVPWDQALDIILQAKNLGLRKNGNVLWIAPKEEINAKEKLEFEAKAAIENLEPLRTQSFQLNYTKATVIAQGLTGTGMVSGSGAQPARILSTRGSVIAEARTNQLFITDVSSKLAQVTELIQKLDVPVRQVLIEARIVEASDSFSKALGVRLGGGIIRSRGTVGAAPAITPNPMVSGSFQNPPTVTTSFTNSNFLNLPALTVNGQAPGTFALSLFNSSLSRLLNLEISALEADGKGKVISSPRVVTADQTKALIEQGTEIPYQVATSSGATSIAFKKAVLKLEVTPQITPEGNIILTLDVNKDSRGETTLAGPAINTKHVQTEVLVENGGTVVIGGIFEMEESHTEDRVPVLGEMPVLGALFRTRNRLANKTEMLIFITPKMIIDAMALR